MILRDDLPLAIDWEALRTQPPDREALLALCTECGFHGFRDELGRPPRPPARPGRRGSPTIAWSTRPESFAAFLDELSRQPRFCVDTETTALDPLRADLVGLSFSWQEGEAYYLPVRGPEGSRRLDEAATMAALRPILEDPGIEKVGQNLKYDMLALDRAGIELAGPITDTMILSYLLESGERNHNLDLLSQRLLGHEMIPITALIGKGKAQCTHGPGGRRQGGRVRRRGRRRDLAHRVDPGPQGPGRGALGPVRRPRAAVDLGPGADGAGRRGGGRGAAAAALGGIRRADGDDGGRDLPSGRAHVQHQLAAAAPPGALRRAEAALALEDARRRAEHGAGRPGGAGAQAPAAGAA